MDANNATTGKVLVVHATADVMAPGQSTPAEEAATWVATAISAPVAGLFGMGPTLHDARRELAATILLAVTNGATDGLDVDIDDIAAIRILATTRKTFTVDDLTASDGDTGGVQ